MESTNNATKYKEFMSHVERIYLDRLDERKRTASQFNVFDALGLTRSEVDHSNFLRFLLDPNDLHGQGDTFLKAFIANIANVDCQLDLKTTLVTQERILDEFGRVDIAIHLPDKRIILLENKVDAKEGDRQIGRYLDWLATQRNPTIGDHVLLFLTPRGARPISSKLIDPAKVVPVSYAKIGDWLSALITTMPDRLKVVLSQYVDSCRLVGGAMRDDKVEGLRSFLQDPENLEVGFEIAGVVPGIRRHIFEEFWNHVEDELHLRLKGNDAENLWEAFQNEDNGLLGIAWKDGKKGNETFSVSFEGMMGDTYYGICRGKQAMATDIRDMDLIRALELDRFRSSIWWPGTKFVRNYDQLFASEQDKRAVTLLRDNLNQSHPLAAKVANIVWDLFLRHRPILEDLNRSYPYS